MCSCYLYSAWWHIGVHNVAVGSRGLKALGLQKCILLNFCLLLAIVSIYGWIVFLNLLFKVDLTDKYHLEVAQNFSVFWQTLQFLFGKTEGPLNSLVLARGGSQCDG